MNDPYFYTKARAVTPDDDTSVGCTGVWVGTTGDLAVVMKGDADPTVFGAVPDGTFIPIACAKIMSTNTTASNIVALY